MEYDIIEVSGADVYDLSDGETFENKLIDQTEPGASFTIRSRNKSGWTVRNIGFTGTGQAGSGSNRFQFQVSTPDGATGTIENVWASGMETLSQPASQMGGIYIRASHAGHIDIRHTYIEGFGNNAVYGSAPGKDGGNDGSVTIENAYHRDNTVSQFRIGTPGSVVRNAIGVVNDPDGARGAYPGTNNNRSARGVWGKHYPDQRVENSAFYISPDDAQPNAVFHARYIQDRSHGSSALLEAVDCDYNSDAPTVFGSTDGGRVVLMDTGENPTTDVLGDGGVPTSPEMAAAGNRTIPDIPEIAGSTTPTARVELTVTGEDRGNLVATVVDGSDSLPLGGVTVDVRGDGTKMTETTDADGEATFEDIPITDYTVACDPDGYSSATATVAASDFS